MTMLRAELELHEARNAAMDVAGRHDVAMLHALTEYARAVEQIVRERFVETVAATPRLYGNED